jgi:hypothetical protein
MEIYGAFSYHMSHSDFQDFINPSNPIGPLLQSHFIAVQLLLSPITINELGDRKPSGPSEGAVRWLSAIHRHVPPQMMKYVAWPIAAAEAFRAEVALSKSVCDGRT